jgi:hypothetical protein
MYGPNKVNSYENMKGSERRAHEGSQSKSPGKSEGPGRDSASEYKNTNTNL